MDVEVGHNSTVPLANISVLLMPLLSPLLFVFMGWQFLLFIPGTEILLVKKPTSSLTMATVSLLCSRLAVKTATGYYRTKNYSSPLQKTVFAFFFWDVGTPFSFGSLTPFAKNTASSLSLSADDEA